MDDRILLLPPTWAPDPHAAAAAASVRALLDRLEAFLPLDIFVGPTLKGSKRLGTGVEWLLASIREQVRPEHHIVASSTHTEPLLVVLSSQPARSLTIPGFYASPATALAAGDEALASVMTAAHTVVMHGPSEMFPQLMEGADPAQVDIIVRNLEGGLDRQALIEITSDFIETDFLGKAHVELPVLYLAPTTATPAAGLDLLKRFASDVQTGQLQSWGLRIQEEAGGIELAEKAIEFIKQVIAERGANKQT